MSDPAVEGEDPNAERFSIPSNKTELGNDQAEQLLIDMAKASDPQEVDFNNSAIWKLAESPNSPLREQFLKARIHGFKQMKEHAGDENYSFRMNGKDVKVGDLSNDQRQIEMNLASLESELQQLTETTATN